MLLRQQMDAISTIHTIENGRCQGKLFWRQIVHDADDTFEFDSVICIKDSHLACCIKDLDTGETFWVPKSCIHEDSEVFEYPQRGKLIVLAWLAEKEGWTGKQKSALSRDIPKPQRPVPRGAEVNLNIGRLPKKPPCKR